MQTINQKPGPVPTQPIHLAGANLPSGEACDCCGAETDDRFCRDCRRLFREMAGDDYGGKTS